MDVGVRVVGLLALLAKEQTFGARTDGILTDHLLEIGRKVAIDVSDRYIDYSPDGAAHVQEKVFAGTGLWVVQTLRKSRNVMRRRPTFGPLMMRKAFLPAAADNQAGVLLAADLAVQEATALYWDD